MPQWHPKYLHLHVASTRIKKTLIIALAIIMCWTTKQFDQLYENYIACEMIEKTTLRSLMQSLFTNVNYTNGYAIMT